MYAVQNIPWRVNSIPISISISLSKPHLSIIYLSKVLCLSVCVYVYVCVSQFVAERSAILLVLSIKLTKETRRRVWRGRDRDGEIGKRQIVEFPVLPAVALLNYISSGIFWRIFSQTGIFAGFSLIIIDNAGNTPVL